MGFPFLHCYGSLPEHVQKSDAFSRFTVIPDLWHKSCKVCYYYHAEAYICTQERHLENSHEQQIA
ncbi:MAG: hypothetical protein DYG98_03975 [Haliscomenobacteraceae bacterium CHB4]|nr:hypothetical protein [Haliscomenobacteraceae bacterium CHB4]